MSAKHAEYALGIDIGGTNIRAAIISRDGEILQQEHRPTPRTPDDHMGLPDDLLAAIAECARPLLTTSHKIIGIGVGCGGQFNPKTGVMLGVNTGHPAFVNIPFAQRLQDLLGLPVFADSDVKTAAYGELRAGAGRDYQHLLCVAIGTGIGGALILNGQLVQGASGLAGHLGQFPDFKTGELLEDITGGNALGKRAIAKGILQPGQTSEHLFQNLRAGDSAAILHVTTAAQALAAVLVGLCHTFEPQAILMGGTVGVQPEYIEILNTELNIQLMKNWQSIRAIPMQLGTDAGKIGAGLRVFEALIQGE
jgi:glucokinase